jgi:hypothetical protein
MCLTWEDEVALESGGTAEWFLVANVVDLEKTGGILLEDKERKRTQLTKTGETCSSGKPGIGANQRKICTDSIILIVAFRHQNFELLASYRGHLQKYVMPILRHPS